MWKKQGGKHADQQTFILNIVGLDRAKKQKQNKIQEELKTKEELNRLLTQPYN